MDLDKTFADYDNSKTDFFIKVYPKGLVYIIFAYLGTLYSIPCYKDDKIEDICSDFASKNNIDKNKVMFKYQDNSVNQNQTVSDFLEDKNININNIKIDVVDYSHFTPSFFTLHKIKIIIALSVAAVAVTTFTIIYFILKKDHYFIKAIYISEKPNEKVKLISDNFNINKIKKSKIDNSKMDPTRTYIFKEIGNHIILLIHLVKSLCYLKMKVRHF